MKLLRVHIISARTCGGLLDNLDLQLRSPSTGFASFEPLCLVGPNGAGKSQFLQVVAEIFQAIQHACRPTEERRECNPELQFEIEYLIRPKKGHDPVRVRSSRRVDERGRSVLNFERWNKQEWTLCALADSETHRLLPARVVGYTSGDNETLSLPFLVSRAAYADDVGRRALERDDDQRMIADTRLMLIDYGTHLEVLAANLLLGTTEQREALLRDARLQDVHSFRCIVQLAHAAAPSNPDRASKRKYPRRVLITNELRGYVDALASCATCVDFDEKRESYTLDFWLNSETRAAFRAFWHNAVELYSAFHKLAMLNDLVIPKQTRDRFKRETGSRHFASRLPEPQDEEKVFRFERVQFRAQSAPGAAVDYVSLSDGEHQLTQLLGTMCMISYPGVLFLLDEPESHFNPQWRVKCVSRLLDLPTPGGSRTGVDGERPSSEQECILTTHAPFVPSDLPRERVFIFTKENDRVQVKRPDIETFGTTFDTILEECFDVRPPISQVSRDEIDKLKKSTNADEVRAGIQQLGPSVEKAFVADHLRQLTSGEES